MFSSIGDNTTITSCHALPHGIAGSVNIGKNVTIGANCTINSSIIDDDVVIGACSVIGQGARLERGCMIAAGSFVPPGRLIPSGQLWGGSPCTYFKDLSENEMLENYEKSYKEMGEGSSESSWPL